MYPEDCDQPQLMCTTERMCPHVYLCVGVHMSLYVCTHGCVCVWVQVSVLEYVYMGPCLFQEVDPPHISLCVPLLTSGISSSMSFDEEEEDEDENSSSSSQLNSNTRPSSATSRKSIRVSEELLSKKLDGSVQRTACPGEVDHVCEDMMEVL